MQYSVQVSEKVHWIGVNDRRKHLFESIWPLPEGVSYNSYLITAGKTVLVDTIELGSDGSYLERIGALLAGRGLDYLVVNHMELDHAGEIEAIVRRWPEVTVVGNAKTFGIFKSYFSDIQPNLKEVADGETLDIGGLTLKFVYTPWVHWPETMMTYLIEEQTLFSGDAFGTFGTLDGGVLDKDVIFERYVDEMRRYYSNIVGKYGGMVQKALAKLAGVPVGTICSLHGPVWQTRAAEVVGLYDKWSSGRADDAVVIIYASMYGNTALVADYIANQISRSGVTDIKVFDVSKTHPSYLISEIWRCKSVVLGSCSYNANMFPLMENLCREMEHYALAGRKLSIFGTGSWVGGGLRNLKTFAQNIGWEMVGEPIEIMGRPDAEKYALCDAFARAVADGVLKK